MTHQWSPPLVIALLLSLVAGLAASAAGQNIPMLDEHASLCAIFQALSPTPPTRCQERARSIVLRPPAEADPGLRASMPLRPASRLPGTRPGSPPTRISSSIPWPQSSRMP